MNPRLRDNEIVLLVLNWNKTEIVPTSCSLDGHAPISATLRYCRGYGVMGVGLRPIASRPLTGKQAFNQDPRAASRVAIDHHTAGAHPRCRNSGLWSEPVEPGIPWSEDNSLQATVTANELHPRCQKRFVVLTGGRIHEVKWCNVALVALGGSKPPGTPSVDDFYSKTLCL